MIDDATNMSLDRVTMYTYILPYCDYYRRYGIVSMIVQYLVICVNFVTTESWLKTEAPF